MIRAVTTIGLAVVAICAVAVSFAGLYGLAVLCKFPPQLAALVPVLVDAGAGVATAVWLAGDVPRAARIYARCLALGLLAVSVAGNAGSHALVAAGATPSWVVVVLVGALAPAVLAAVTHLSALVKAGGGPVADETARGSGPVLVGMPGFRFTERAPTNDEPAGEVLANLVAMTPSTGEPLASLEQKVAHLVHAKGYGRPRIAKELDVKDHVARDLLATHRDGCQECQEAS